MPKNFTKFLSLSIKLLFLLVCLPIDSKAQDLTKEFQIVNFNSISISTGINVYLTQDSVEKISVIGPEVLLNDMILVKEASGNLKMEMNNYLLQNWKWGKNEPLKVLISFKNLNQISLNNSASISSLNVLNFDNLCINLDDASNSKFDLTANNLTVNLNNGSDIRLLGSTISLNIEASNGCNIKAFELTANNVKAELTNGSDGEFNALYALNVFANNKSDVQYIARKKMLTRFKSLDKSSIKKVKK